MNEEGKTELSVIGTRVGTNTFTLGTHVSEGKDKDVRCVSLAPKPLRMGT